jgi:hypothetical protein
VSKKQTPNNQIPDKPINQLNSLKAIEPMNKKILTKPTIEPRTSNELINRSNN